MSDEIAPEVVLPQEVAVVNVGLSLFADAVREQGVAVQQVGWRIPAGGDPELVGALERLYGARSRAIDAANAEVVRRLDQGVPLLVDVAPAGTLVPGMSDRLLLHCGPAVGWDEACDPLRRSMRAAAVAEGWARGRCRGRPPAERRRRAAGAGLRARHRGADGHGDRPLGAGAGGRQRCGGHTGLRPHQPGAGRRRPGSAGTRPPPSTG